MRVLRRRADGGDARHGDGSTDGRRTAGAGGSRGIAEIARIAGIAGIAGIDV